MRIIIVGAGEVGNHIAQRLALENKEVVVIDRSPDALKRVGESSDVQTIEGSGCSPEILLKAGIEGADILLAVTDSDEVNILACFFANQLCSTTVKLARIRSSDYTQYKNLLAHETLNIDKVINPDQEVVKSVLRLMDVPGAVEISEFAGGKIRFIGVTLPVESPLIGAKLYDIRNRIGNVPLVIGVIVRDDQLIIPGGADEILEGDVVYFACEVDRQAEIIEKLGIRTEPVRKVLIVGGGNIGYHLAKALDNKQYHTRLLDSDMERCKVLSEKLDRPIVLQGDGTDRDILKQENVGDMDLVIAVTGDEEINILTCLLAKSLGAKTTTTRINNFAYMPLIEPIGIDHLVCPRLSAINSLLHYIRRGKVLSTASIKGDEAEVLEAIAQKNSEIVGKPIMDLGFPKGCNVLCFQRGEKVIIPRGDTVIEPEDRLIIVSTRQDIDKVEKALTVKVEFL